MKNYIKGVLTGLFIMAVVWCIPAVAENVEVFFNRVAINVDGIDVATWGEEYVLDNGDAVPYSITYNNTTYLPMRKLAELMDKEIYWNGDSKKVSLTAKQETNTQEILAEQPDQYGNVWTYYTFEAVDGKGYLGVKDKTRNYERVYKLSSSKTYVTEDEIYFITPRLPKWPADYPRPHSSDILRKITFSNDVDTQDGTEIQELSECIFDDGYAYGMTATPGDTMVQSYIWGKNLSTGSGDHCAPNGGWRYAYGVKLMDSNAQEATLRYYESEMVVGTKVLYEVKFYKGDNAHFGEPVRIEIRDLDGNLIQ